MPNLIPHFIHEQYTRQQRRGEFQVASLAMDVSGFTELTETILQNEKMDAEVLTNTLNRIFSPLVANVYQHGGFITTFAGDAFTAIFPLEKTDAILHAAQAGLHIQKFFAEHSSFKTPYGSFTLGVRVGIASGDVQWGIVGNTGDSQQTFFFRGRSLDTCLRGQRIVAPGQVGVENHLLQMDNRIRTAPLPVSGYQSLITTETPSANPSCHVETIPKADLIPFLQKNVLDAASGPISGEFRQVAPVFISFDIPEEHAFEEFVLAAIRLTGEYGGYFNKLDFDEKGGILISIFGAPLAHENDLTRAANFLLALRDLPEAANIRWRAGLSFGMAYAGLIGGDERCEYTAIGDVVNLAARLMQNAPTDEIWLSSQAIHQVRKAFDIKLIGATTFKGFSRPQQVHRLLGRRKQLQTFTTRLVGRSHELSALEKFITPLWQGQFCGMLTVFGEAGIGKSHLLHEFQQRIVTTDLQPIPPRWMLAQADAVLRPSLHPLRYALQDYFGLSIAENEQENRTRFDHAIDALIASSAEPGLTAELERTRPFLAGLLNLPETGTLYTELDPKLRFENTLIAVITLLMAESLRQPIILQIEDLQHIDQDTQVFLQRLARAIPPEERPRYPIALLASSRQEPPANLLGDPADSRAMLLDILPGDALVPLAEDVLGQSVSQELIHTISVRAGGNPFFVEQLLNYLREQNLLTPGSGGLKQVAGDIPLPMDTRAVLVARFDSMSLPVKEIIQFAAVLGREFDATELATMHPDAELQEKLDVAEKEGIWFSLGNRYLFKHAMQRDAVYEMQLQSRRRELHEQAIRAIETVHADNLSAHINSLAHHAEMGHDTSKQREYYRLAGDAARLGYANTRAIDFYRKLLPLLQGTAEKVPVHIHLGDVLQLVGDVHEAKNHYLEALELAQQAKDSALMAECEYTLGIWHRIRAEYDTALMYLNLAAERWQLIDNRQNLGHTLAQIAVVLWRHRDFATAEARAKEALAAAVATEDPQGMAFAFNQIGNIAWSQQDYANARSCYIRMMELAQNTRDQMMLARALHNLALVTEDNEPGPYTKGWLRDQSLLLHRQIGNKIGEASALNNIGWDKKLEGDFAASIPYFQQALNLYRQVEDRWGVALSLNNLGLMLLELSDYASARPLFEEDIALYNEFNDQGGLINALSNLGLSMLGLGNPQAAGELLLDGLQRRIEHNQLDGRNYSLIGLAGVASALGQDALSVQMLSAAEEAPSELERVYQRLGQSALAIAKERLNPGDFSHAWDEGKKRSLDEFLEQVRSACKQEPSA